MTAEIVRPTSERIRKGDIVVAIEERGAPAKPWTAKTLPHDCLEMTQAAHGAGSRFHETYVIAHGSDTRTHKWERGVDNSARRDMSAEQAEARKDLARWERHLAPSLYGVLESSCGHGVASSRWAADNGEHPSVGPAMLAVACEQLARLL